MEGVPLVISKVSDLALERLARKVQSAGYRFVTVTPATIERVNARPRNDWARDLRGVFGYSRRFLPEALPSEIFDAMLEAGVAARDGEGYRSTIRLSTLDPWIFIHSAYPTVDGDSVFFGPDTYRYAAAIRAHLEASEVPIRRAVDIGSGAGVGAIVIASARKEARAHAVDINPAALRLTSINARLAQLDNVIVQESNLLDGTEGGFDLIVANPPYLLDEEARLYRHGGDPLGAGLSIAIVDKAIERLEEGGTMLLYTGVAMVDGRDPFLEIIRPKLERAGIHWDYREIDPDVFGEELLTPAYAHIERIAVVLLRVVRRPPART